MPYRTDAPASTFLSKTSLWILLGVATGFLGGFGIAYQARTQAWHEDNSVPVTPSASLAADPQRGEQVVASWTRQLAGAQGSELISLIQSTSFPPEIRRALLVAIIQEKYRSRRDALEDQRKVTPYWQKPKTDPDWRSANRKLNREMSEEIRASLKSAGLMPENVERRTAERFEGVDPSKHEQLRALLTDYSDMISEVRNSGEEGRSMEERKKLEMLEKARQEDLARLLTPTELLEYNLRTSPTASRLRDQLNGFDVSESEFRTLYQAVADYQAKNPSSISPNGLEEFRAMTSEVMKSVAGSLTAERREALTQALDIEYSAANRFVVSQQLPVSTAKSLVTLARETQIAIGTTLASPDLPPGQRKVAAAAALTAAQVKLKEVLGEDGFEAYQGSPVGSWLRSARTRVK